MLDACALWAPIMKIVLTVKFVAVHLQADNLHALAV
jgi:hypothetical protein